MFDHPPSVPRLVISRRHLHAVEVHAAGSYPIECCGFLLGHPPSPPGPAIVTRVLPARNEHGDARAGFLIRPEIVLAARREARRLGLEVIGYYHSHPDGAGEPSARDREHAWRDVSYLIVPVADGRPGAARSWRLPAGADRFVEERVERPGTTSDELARSERPARPRPAPPGGSA